MTRSVAPTIDRHDADAGEVESDRGDRATVARGRQWGIAVGSAVAAYVLLATGVLPGWLTVVLSATLLVTVPTARFFSRRIVLNAAILVGWTQVLWWVEWPFPINHGALLTAFATGVVAARLVTATDRRTAVHNLLPRLRPVDALIPISVVLATAALWKWVSASSPQRALEALLPGADNYAHFHMFSTLRAYGATTTTLGSAPDGSGWGFNEYPQGFHALVATVSELMAPDFVAGPHALIAYVHAVPLVVALGLAMVTAATVSLPGVRNRPELAAPAVVLTWMAFLWEPGQNLLADGFGNFVLAGASGATALLLAINRSRHLMVVELAAIAGLFMFIANAWAPLIVIAAPAALAVITPWNLLHGTQKQKANSWARVVVILASGYGVAKAFFTLFTQIKVSTVVSACCGIHGTSPLPTIVLFEFAVAVCLLYPKWVARKGLLDDLPMARRVRLMALAPIFGLLAGAALFTAQLSTLGTTAYYFIKFLIGFELILAAFAPAVAALALAYLSRRPTRRFLTIVVTVTAIAVATQAFGRFPRSDPPLLSRDHDGTASVGPPFSAEGMAHGILTAVAATSRDQAFQREYVALGRDGAVEPMYPDGWYHAILTTLTRDVQKRVDVLRRRAHTVHDAAPLVRSLLVKEPDLEVVVDPQYAPALRNSLGSEDLARRVVTWRSVHARVG